MPNSLNGTNHQNDMNHQNGTNHQNDMNHQNNTADTDYSDSICSILYAQAHAKARY